MNDAFILLWSKFIFRIILPSGSLHGANIYQTGCLSFWNRSRWQFITKENITIHRNSAVKDKPTNKMHLYITVRLPCILSFERKAHDQNTGPQNCPQSIFCYEIKIIKTQYASVPACCHLSTLLMSSHDTCSALGGRFQSKSYNWTVHNN